VQSDGRTVSGISLGVDADGALRVRGDDGEVLRVISGEIAT
jgi:biotin-(acetyl-CoA carboxylase) ligase